MNNAIGAWFVSLTAVAPVIDVLQRWYYSRDIDVPEGCSLPSQWVCWGKNGRFMTREGEMRDCRFFLLRLPLYDWVPAFDRYTDRLQCVQWAIYKYGGGPWHFRQIGIGP